MVGVLCRFLHKLADQLWFWDIEKRYTLLSKVGDLPKRLNEEVS